ncbi:YrzE family protein [Psychrobacter sp. I-STPA10]|uniref:YrzE family protein n=1 Tax=Psychrobacter sp. I-STPA10 TaxID=2585769 RepID=UPI001E5C520B|nr:YrzE family protein [Psychrobacter sp. I-STPA10]
MTPTYNPQRRPSWRGILAGLLMGLIVVMAMFALALILTSFVPSFDLKGTSIAAGIYAVITALISAFVAGYYAVKCSAPEALFGDGTAIDPKDATLTGMLTAASIIFITTFFTMSSATSILSTTTRAVGSTVSTVASATASTVGAGASAVGSVADTVLQNSNINLQQEAQKVYQQVSGDVSRDDIEKWIAKNTDSLSQEQVAATTDVVEQMVNETKGEVQQLDFTDLDTWRHLDEIAKQRMSEIEAVLTGPEIIERLQAQGLSEAEALQVRQEVSNSFNEYKAQTEQVIASAQQKADQAKQRVDEALVQAEETARKAALYTGLFWLISAFLTFLASIMGARKAAVSYRLEKPIISWGDNVR